MSFVQVRLSLLMNSIDKQQTMIKQGYLGTQYYALYQDCIQFFDVQDSQDLHNAKPSISVSYMSTANSCIILQDGVLCETTYSQGYFLNRITKIFGIPPESMVVKTEDPVTQIRMIDSGEVYCSNSNSIVLVDLQNKNHKLVVEEEGKLLKFSVDKDTIYSLSQHLGKRNLAVYRKKDVLAVHFNVIDFVLNNNKLELLHSKYGQVFLNQTPLDLPYLERDIFVLRCVRVVSQTQNLLCLTHTTEPNTLYYFFEGGKYRHSATLPTEEEQTLPQCHFVTKEQSTLDYQIQIAQNKTCKTYILQLINPVNELQLQAYREGRLSLSRHQDSLVLSNLGVLFVNGIINPHFQDHISSLYEDQSLRSLPFGETEMMSFYPSIANSYEVFKILLINHYGQFTKAFGTQIKHFPKFNLYINQFVGQLVRNYHLYAFSQEYVDIMENSIKKVKTFNQELTSNYIERMEEVLTSELNRQQNNIVEKIQAHTEACTSVCERIQVFEAVLQFVRRRVSREQISEYILRHREVKHQLQTSNPHVKLLIEHFQGFSDCLQRGSYQREEFIGKLFGCRKLDVLYVAKCIWSQPELGFSSTDSCQNVVLIAKDLLFRDWDEKQATMRTLQLLKQDVKVPQYFLTSIIEILLAKRYFVAALSILYSPKYDWTGDIANFSKAHLQAGKIEMGYLTISGVLDLLLVGGHRREAALSRKQIFSQYISRLFESQAIMETVMLAIDMPQADSQIVKEIGASLVPDIGLYLD